MFILSVIALLLASISFLMLRKIPDEAVQLTVFILSILCLIVSLIHSPWLIKLCMTVPLLILPLYHPTAQPPFLTCFRSCPQSCQSCRKP